MEDIFSKIITIYNKIDLIMYNKTEFHINKITSKLPKKKIEIFKIMQTIKNNKLKHLINKKYRKIIKIDKKTVKSKGRVILHNSIKVLI